ncbi:hypothetical protein DFH11DRAFT_1606964 [Phellopilus nigrolimitatus]|nr:hypothetical protein DFH11DRAFT_1606964 [Phellopilus nigrolimitatus]
MACMCCIWLWLIPRPMPMFIFAFMPIPLIPIPIGFPTSPPTPFSVPGSPPPTPTTPPLVTPSSPPTLDARLIPCGCGVGELCARLVPREVVLDLVLAYARASVRDFAAAGRAAGLACPAHAAAAAAVPGDAQAGGSAVRQDSRGTPAQCRGARSAAAAAAECAGTGSGSGFDGAAGVRAGGALRAGSSLWAGGEDRSGESGLGAMRTSARTWTSLCSGEAGAAPSGVRCCSCFGPDCGRGRCLVSAGGRSCSVRSAGSWPGCDYGSGFERFGTSRESWAGMYSRSAIAAAAAAATVRALAAAAAAVVVAGAQDTVATHAAAGVSVCLLRLPFPNKEEKKAVNDYLEKHQTPETCHPCRSYCPCRPCRPSQGRPGAGRMPLPGRAGGPAGTCPSWRG